MQSAESLKQTHCCLNANVEATELTLLKRVKQSEHRIVEEKKNVLRDGLDSDEEAPELVSSVIILHMSNHWSCKEHQYNKVTPRLPWPPATSVHPQSHYINIGMAS